MTMTTMEHDDAVRRVHRALAEQSRMSDSYSAAIGTSSELSAYMNLRAAANRVAGREAWLHWVDDESYRGLNAGPFELRAEELATKPHGAAFPDDSKR
ncbi:MAG: hypothetical protein NVS2B6_03490 [Thermoleophilaceae bacterium]